MDHLRAERGRHKQPVRDLDLSPHPPDLPLNAPGDGPHDTGHLNRQQLPVAHIKVPLVGQQFPGEEGALMQLFRSFTEAELKDLIDRLLAKKQRREGRPGRRPKRAGGRGQTKAHRQCSLREEQLTVSDLGLGYLSDETIIFRYCSGSCRQLRRNYDLIMKKWRREGVSRRDRAPCCRPIEYEGDIVVLDINNKYKTLHEYSAQKCGCV
ncbi:glial cell line-derived neurotrophic factor [Diretmus argenteus]